MKTKTDAAHQRDSSSPEGGEIESTHVPDACVLHVDSNLSRYEAGVQTLNVIKRKWEGTNARPALSSPAGFQERVHSNELE